MKILSILTAKKGTLTEKAAQRIARQLTRNQERKIDNLDAEKDSLLAKKEVLESITVDTSPTKLESWADDYHDVVIKLELIDQQISIARRTLKEMFTDDKQK